jgi:hypothetical protein
MAGNRGVIYSTQAQMHFHYSTTQKRQRAQSPPSVFHVSQDNFHAALSSGPGRRCLGIGTTEFIIMGLLTQVSSDLGISIPRPAPDLGYAVGVAVGAPVLTLLTRHWPRKRLLLGLMLIFIAGNLAAVIAPTCR